MRKCVLKLRSTKQTKHTPKRSTEHPARARYREGARDPSPTQRDSAEDAYIDKMATKNAFVRLLFIVVSCSLLAVTADDEFQLLYYRYVTCGSLTKLLNLRYEVRLHSHKVSYSEGSGQQSVTGTEKPDDINSHWMVKGRTDASCPRGQRIKCGDVVRLEHLQTRRNLHSHHYASPLTSKQEISAFGENGNGNSGDLWTVVCKTSYWERGVEVRLKHSDTEAWLSVSGQSYGSQLGGQLEVCGDFAPRDDACTWKTAEGVFVKPTRLPVANRHTEL